MEPEGSAGAGSDVRTLWQNTQAVPPFTPMVSVGIGNQQDVGKSLHTIFSRRVVTDDEHRHSGPHPFRTHRHACLAGRQHLATIRLGHYFDAHHAGSTACARLRTV